MEQEFTVEFECRYRAKVRCKLEDLADEIANLNIPEDDETKYVEDTFEPFSIEDEDGNVIEV